MSSEAFTRVELSDHETWLETRKKYLQASDAPAICGVSPWKDRTTIWDEKAGLVKAKDISGRPHVQYGKKMEPHIRAQFLLDNPYFECDYHEFDILVNKSRPWQGCTLDGELRVMAHNPWNLPIGARGVLECKTGSYRSREEYMEWRLFPVHYYVQICHQLSVTGWSFAISASRIKRDPFFDKDNGFPKVHTLYHIFLRSDSDISQDIRSIEEKEKEFKETLDKGIRPAFTLRRV